MSVSTNATNKKDNGKSKITSKAELALRVSLDSLEKRMDKLEKIIADTDKVIDIQYDTDGPFLPPDIVEVWRDTPEGPVFCRYQGRRDKPHMLAVEVESFNSREQTFNWEYNRLMSILNTFNVEDKDTGQVKHCLHLESHPEVKEAIEMEAKVKAKEEER